MKTLIVSILALGSLGFVTSCTTVEQREPTTHTRTTTTEQTTLRQPQSSTVETRTYRSN